MKATQSGRVMGCALEPFSKTATSSDGMIEVTINVHDAFIRVERMAHSVLKYIFPFITEGYIGITAALRL
jgi:hypothetical protein